MPLPCPDCAMPLPQPVGRCCPSCLLPLTGPDAARLHQLDLQLAALTAERQRLIAALRDPGSAAVWAAPVLAGHGPGAAGAALGRPLGWWGSRLAGSPQRVLLALGALLVLVATTVFLAVVWLRIGLLGQAAVMTGLVLASGTAAVVAARRRLDSTATTLAWLTAGLAAVGLQAGRALGLPGLAQLNEEGAVALTAAVGAGLAALAVRRSRIGAFGVQAVLSSGVVVPALLLAADAAPPVVLAAAGTWGLLAVAGRRRAALLHPAAAPAALRGGATAVGGAVLLGMLVAVVEVPATAAAAAGVTACLAGLALAGVLRSVASPGAAAALAATSLGTAVALLAVRIADATQLSPDRALTATGIVAVLVAAVLLGMAGNLVRWWALAGVVCGGLALLAAVGDAAHGFTALLSLTVAGAATALAVLRPHRVGPGAVPVAAGAGSAALVTGLLAAGSTTSAVVLVAGALAVATGAAAALRHDDPEEPGLGLVAAVTGGCALAGTALLAEPALIRAGLLAAGGVLALAYGCLPRRGALAPVGVALAAAASWTLLDARGVELLEAYTLPVAALLLAVGLVRVRRVPDAPSWTTVGPAAAFALVPSAALAAETPHGLRALLVTVAAVAVLLAGLQLRAQALVVTAGLVVVQLALVQVGQAALFLPRWVVLGTLGALLLAAGATYETRLRQVRGAGAWLRALR